MLFILLSFMAVSISNAQQFTVQPQSVVQALGLQLEAVFECQYQIPVSAYGWRLDGSTLNLPSPGVETKNPSTDSPTAKLIINPTSQYYINGTAVQCRAFDSAQGNPLSENATLSIQGTSLPNIQNSESGVTISWDNPFTTNLTFCVDVRSVGSSEIVSSVCVSDTQHTFTSLDSDLCDQLSFTVTPTDGRSNGTASNPVTGYFQSRRGIEYIQCRHTVNSQDNLCWVIFNTSLSCNCELMFSTIDPEALTPINERLTIGGNGSRQYPLGPVIPSDRHYSVNVTIFTSSGQYELPQQNITSHDIIDADADADLSTPAGAVSTSCTFVPNTTAMGYLAIISSNESKNGVPIFVAEYNTDGTGDLTEDIGPGGYQVAFFDLESNGIPNPGNHSLSGSARMDNVTVLEGSRENGQHLNTGISFEEAITEMSENQTCFFCSSIADCLVLMYDCMHPDILLSVFVPVNHSNCTSLQVTPSQYCYVAYFELNNSNSEPLMRHPGKVEPVSIAQHSSATSTTASTSVLLLLCVLYAQLAYG